MNRKEVAERIYAYRNGELYEVNGRKYTEN